MSSKRQKPGDPARGLARDELASTRLLELGQLHFLAAFCPLHQTLQAGWLARLFIPALNIGCVRFFNNEASVTCAALIWARLSDEVSERMIYEHTPPPADDWNSGDNLWFLDLLAPFGHGRLVARHIARNPPDGPFYFARLDDSGKINKVVRGDASRRGPERVRSFQVDQRAQGAA